MTTAVASGHLSRKITIDVRGEIQQLKEAINTMVDLLRSFVSEVTRVAREHRISSKSGSPGHQRHFGEQHPCLLQNQESDRTYYQLW